MENKRKQGAPKKDDLEKKVSVTCSISNSVNSQAVRLYKTRGKAIELAVKYYSVISHMEIERRVNNP